MKHKILKGIAIVGLALTLSSCSFNWDRIRDVPGGAAEDAIKDHEHNYKEEVVAPTCEEEGYTLHYCTCRENYKTDVKPALGHNYVTDAAVSKTCTTDGKTEGSHCSNCGKVKVEQQIIPKGHEFKYSYSKEPTCTEEGYITGYACELCHEAHGESAIPALGHSSDDAGVKRTLTNGCTYLEHTCKTCGKKYADTYISDYTTNQDYIEFTTNPIYSSVKTGLAAGYKAFYDSCLAVKSSTKDYLSTDDKIGSFDYADAGLTYDQTFNLFSSFKLNNPEFYFLYGQISYTSKTVYIKIQSQFYKSSSRVEMNQNIRRMESLLSDKLTAFGESDYKKAKRIHDFILNEIDYAYEDAEKTVPSTAEYAHNIVGFMDGNKDTNGVCECYAKSYLYLSRFIGLTSSIACGTSEGGGHGWNYTKIGSTWYGMDCTWDDQTTIIYKYFLCGSDTLDLKHTAGNTNISMTPSSGFFQTPVPVISTSDYA